MVNIRDAATVSNLALSLIVPIPGHGGSPTDSCFPPRKKTYHDRADHLKYRNPMLTNSNRTDFSFP